MVIVTHDIGEAILLSDRVFVMSSNPGTIRTVIDIKLKRPRESSVRVEKTFRVKEMNIRNLLNNEQGKVA
jgi:ABC-type nitrate/sulfonate/bicarbonate transport system ATPase subunit